MMRHFLMLLCVLSLTGCNFWRGNEQIGRGPSNWDPYSGPAAEHGKPVPVPAAAAERTTERQSELLGQFIAFYQRLLAQEERRANETGKWINDFLKEHRNVPPEPALGVVNAHDEANLQREKLMAKYKELQEKPLEADPADPKAVKEAEADRKARLEAMEKAIKDATDIVDMFKKYIQEQPIVASAYKQRIDDYKAAQERSQVWQARLNRLVNTSQSVAQNKLNADSEIDRSIVQLVDHLKIKDEATRLEVIEMLRSLGAESKPAVEALRKLAQEVDISDAVRSASARTAAAISAQ